MSDIRWSVRAAGYGRPTTVTICTHNQVEDCLNTAVPGGRRRADARVALVRVVDQVVTRWSPGQVRGDRGRVSARSVYQRQPNARRRRRFTRGLYGAAGDPADDRDVLLMDDGVLLDPEIVVRLTGFAACTATRRIVGEADAQPAAPRPTCTSPPGCAERSGSGSAGRCRARREASCSAATTGTCRPCRTSEVDTSTTAGGPA
ncbi:hypothetical protein HBB16_08105 [Pseudonocardia sp. MCCB 268]|nr:hypothetical protein [Pseudonocardia cytotoxica]